MKTDLIHSFFFFFIFFNSIDLHQTASVESSSREEIYDGVNYGKLLLIDGRVWLQADFTIGKSTSVLIARCPSGFSPITRSIGNRLISSLGANAADILINQANYDKAYSYISPDKSSTGPYIFKGYKFDGNPIRVSDAFVDLAVNYNQCRTKCYLSDPLAMKMVIKGQTTDDLELGKYYQWEVVEEPNAKSYSWNLGNGTTSTNSVVIFKADKEETRTICANVSVNGWFTKSQCFDVNVKKLSGLIQYSPEDEIIKSVNYGKLVQIGTQIWISKDVQVLGAAVPGASCPVGFRGATLTEYATLVDAINKEPSPITKMDTTRFYMTTKKLDVRYPVYEGFSLVNNAIKTTSKNTNWDNRDHKQLIVRCIATDISNDFAIRGQPISDLNVGKNYTFEIEQTNAVAYAWNFSEENGAQTTRLVTYIPNSTGRKTICANVTVFGGGKKSKCFEFYVQPSSDNSNSNQQGDVGYSSHDEILGGLNFGKLIRFGGLIWLQADLPLSRSKGTLNSNCPNGFSPPTKKIYDAMISSLGADAFYTMTRQLNYSLNNYYMTQTRSANPDQYVFAGIRLDQNPNHISSIEKKLLGTAGCRTKCYLSNSKAMQIFIKGHIYDDLEVGLSYRWEIIEPNAVSYSWSFGYGIASTNSAVTFIATKEEKRTICVNVSVNGWFNKSRCFQVNIKNPYKTSRSPSEIVTFSDEITYSTQDEIIQGKNYGKLIKIGTQIWLGTDISIAGATDPTTNCPSGYRAPYGDEYTNLIGVFRSNAYQNLFSKAKMNPARLYMTQELVDTRYPVYTGLQFIGSFFKKISQNTNWDNREGQLLVRCILNDFNIPFEIKGLPKADLILDKTYNFELLTSNSFTYDWVIETTTSQTKSITFTPKRIGKYEICIAIGIFGGFTKSYCKKVFVMKPRNEIDTTLTPEKYHKVALNILAKTIGYIGSSSVAPLAPRENGNVFMIYTLMPADRIQVVELYPNGTIVPNSLCNLNRTGTGMDMVATPWGFVAYLADHKLSKASLLGVFPNCTVKYEKVIFANKPNGTLVLTDQLMFYETNSSTGLIFGMQLMSGPQTGRLSYGRERLAFNFAHSNLFPKGGGHGGASIVMFDSETGGDEKLATFWHTSHSMNEASMYDGEQFLLGNCGDSMPQGVHLLRCEGAESDGRIDPYTGKKNRVACHRNGDYIPKWPSKLGFSSGRWAGFVVLNESEYGAVYSQRACVVEKEGVTTVNTIRQIAMAVFDNNMDPIRRVVIADGQKNNILKVARYGRNLVIGHSISECGDGPWVCKRLMPDQEKYYLKLIDPTTGRNISEISVSILPSTDDFKTLADGRVAYITFDNMAVGSLTYNYLDEPGK